MVRTVATDTRFYVNQADAVLAQVNPISGTQYDVGVFAADQLDVRLITVIAYVEWTVQPSPLQVHVTLDGIVHSFNVANPVSGLNYYALSAPFGVAGDQILEDDYDGAVRKAFMIEASTVSITAETTGGTVQALGCRVKWSEYV